MLATGIEAKRLEKTSEDKDLIVMGDFNIPSREDALVRAITKHGLCVPRALLARTARTWEKDKRYDQILHHPIYPESFTKAGGELDFYLDEAHIKELFPGGMTKEKFTYQLSDHLPLWIQINTDIEGRSWSKSFRVDFTSQSAAPFQPHNAGPVRVVMAVSK